MDNTPLDQFHFGSVEIDRIKAALPGRDPEDVDRFIRHLERVVGNARVDGPLHQFSTAGVGEDFAKLAVKFQKISGELSKAEVACQKAAVAGDHEAAELLQWCAKTSRQAQHRAKVAARIRERLRELKNRRESVDPGNVSATVAWLFKKQLDEEPTRAEGEGGAFVNVLEVCLAAAYPQKEVDVAHRARAALAALCVENFSPNMRSRRINAPRGAFSIDVSKTGSCTILADGVALSVSAPEATVKVDSAPPKGSVTVRGRLYKPR